MLSIGEIQHPHQGQLIDGTFCLTSDGSIQSPFPRLGFTFRVQVDVDSVVRQYRKRRQAYAERIHQAAQVEELRVVRRGEDVGIEVYLEGKVAHRLRLKTGGEARRAPVSFRST